MLATAPLGLPMAKLSLLLSTAGVASSVLEQAVASSRSAPRMAVRGNKYFINKKGVYKDEPLMTLVELPSLGRRPHLAYLLVISNLIFFNKLFLNE